MLYSGVWGSVCVDDWSDTEATVICRQLGYTGKAEAVATADYGTGSGLLFMNDVKCNGDEERLSECNHAGWSTHRCGRLKYVGVKCDVQSGKSKHINY